jgi:hypothetical protein
LDFHANGGFARPADQGRQNGEVPLADPSKQLNASGRNPEAAAPDIAGSASVTPAIALTTTTGRSSKRPSTMSATRLIAVSFSTEVPPNFITIMLAPLV